MYPVLFPFSSIPIVIPFIYQVAITVASGSLMFSARAKAAGIIFKNPMSLASFLGRLASMSALAEFLLNPIFGKLSDTYGRRAIMPLGHMSLVFCRSIMFLNPTSMWPLILEQILTVPLITSFFTTWRAALSDEVRTSIQRNNIDLECRM